MSLKTSLEKAGLSLGRAAAGGAIAVLSGAGALANYNGMYGLGIALCIGAGAGVLRLIQTWLPGLTFGVILTKIGLGAYTSIVDSFARAYASSLAVFAIGILNGPDKSVTKAATAAAFVAAYTAGIRAVQALLTKGEQPFAGIGK